MADKRGHDWLEIIVGVLAVLSIILVALISTVTFSPEWLLVLYVSDFLICVVFAWDFSLRLKEAPDKSRFWKFHGYEILAMIPAVAFYSLGNLAAISAFLRSIRLIRVVFILARATRFMRTSFRFVRRSHLIYLIIIYLSVIFIGAFVELSLESGLPGSQINSYGDAIWMSVSMATAVGYGNIMPVTEAGRTTGIVLMILGTVILATLVGQISATVVESRLVKEEKEADLQEQLKSQIKEKIDRIDTLSDDEYSLLQKLIQTLRDHRK